MTTLLSWVKQQRFVSCDYQSYSNTDVEVFLDDTYEKVENVPGLKTTLYQHQKTIVKAMMDLETNRCFISKHLFDTEKNYEIKTTAGVLSEAVGSGKTVDVLSLIILQKIPTLYADIANIELLDNSNSKKLKNCFTSVIRKKFNNMLTGTIIFASVSVINQWVLAIKDFTNLSYFAVYDVRDLQKLINMMVDKSINQYDIIIVKNGKVTRSVELPACITVEHKNLSKSALYIYNIIANMRNYCWARVVVDDFDTIKLPHNAGIVNAIFTWYISSTRKYMPCKVITNKQFYKTSDMLMYSNYNCSNIMKNPILFHMLNIRNHPDFITKTNNISSPKFFAYIFVNPNDKYMRLMGLMNNNEASEIMEMLNGDALETAAELIGIKTNNVADIFQIILGKQFDKYKKSVNVLEYIKEVEPMQGKRTPMCDNPDEDDTYKKSDLFIRRPIEYNYPNLKGILDNTKEEYTEIRRESSIGIERVKNNIKEGECPICSSELNDDDEEILIIKCCGIIVCGMCCFGTIFPKGSSRGQCSNCRSKLNLHNLIYLNCDFDLSKIVDEELNKDEDEEKGEEKGEEKEEEKVDRTKINAIIDIIHGIKPQKQKRIDVNIHNMMKGTHKLPDGKYNKVLIFANYSETITNIKKKLDTNEIVYWKLGGTHKEINHTVELFNKCKNACVLIINSMKHCSGLNLQSATDLIFAHKIIDANVETQVIGRGQRLGRKNQLKVHFMFYQNEYDWMVRNNTIREIADSD